MEIFFLPTWSKNVASDDDDDDETVAPQ